MVNHEPLLYYIDPLWVCVTFESHSNFFNILPNNYKFFRKMMANS